MKKVMFVPADDAHLDDFNKFEKSLRKFHSEEELPLIRWSDKGNDSSFWFRAKPFIAKKLFQDGYETVIGADADQIVLGKLDHIWEGAFDVATVLNDPTFPIGVLDIGPEFGTPYFNNGLVVMKNPAFVEHWFRLCYSPHIERFQYREQDILNIICSDYLNYKVRCLDLEGKIHGEYAKPVWSKARVEGDKIMVDSQELKLIHFGGGSGDPSKGNYKIRFQEPVVEFIEKLIK